MDDYEFVDKVGGGRFSVVYKAFIKTAPKTTVAIKCVEKCYQNDIIKEISFLRFLKHDYIVELIDIEWRSEYIYIITKYCNEGDLSDFIRKKRKLAEPLVKTLMQQLALALEYLYRNGICHMDLKPKNLLLLSKPNLKLKVADFGLSQVISSDNVEQSRYAGTLEYIAPEKLLKQQFDARVDLWSVGIIMYECLFGRAPYVRLNIKGIINLMAKRTPIKLPKNVNISSTCENLIHALLKYDPNERIGFEEFFKHDFIDLIYEATPENYLAAVKLIEEAITLDQMKQYSSSLPKYKEAVQYLDAFVITETNTNTKAILNLRRDEYTKWAVALMDLIDGKGLPQHTVSQPLPHLTGNRYQLLCDLPFVTPNIATGLDIGNTGEQECNN